MLIFSNEVGGSFFSTSDPPKYLWPPTIRGQIWSSAPQVSVGLVKVEGPKNIEGLVKMSIQVKTTMTMKEAGITLTQAAAVLARKDHLRLLLQFG